MSYIYKVDSELHKNFKQIKLIKGTKVFICIYNVLYKINDTKKNPFLRYLLYKYSDESAFSDLMTFPFFTHENENILNTANNKVCEITNKRLKPKGYLKNEDGLFIFYNHDLDDFIFEKKMKKDNFWWTIIDEICNLKKVLYFKIHDSVINIFLKNPFLIYLYDTEDKKFEIPIISFKGEHYKLINYIASFGIRPSSRSRFGPFYTSGTYNWAVRYAGWSRYYTKQEFLGKKITDDNGKFKKGGILRLITFLGNLEEQKVILYNKDDYFYKLIKFYDDVKEKSEENIKKHREKNNKYKGKWSLESKCLVVPKIKFNNDIGYFNINTEYIIDNGDNQLTLSIHELNMESLKVVWDPLYDGYEIL
jgi:hypothetical protein